MPEDVICEWFLLCDHSSVGVSPVSFTDSGFVPVCERCATKLGLKVYPWLDGAELSAGEPIQF